MVVNSVPQDTYFKVSLVECEVETVGDQMVLVPVLKSKAIGLLENVNWAIGKLVRMKEETYEELKQQAKERQEAYKAQNGGNQNAPSV